MYLPLSAIISKVCFIEEEFDFEEKRRGCLEVFSVRNRVGVDDAPMEINWVEERETL